MPIPLDVLNALDKLEAPDKDAVLKYIASLTGEEPEISMKEKEEPQSDKDMPDADSVEEESSEEPPFPPLYESGDDYDNAAELKQEATDLKSSGDLEGSLEKYNQAVLAAPPSALLYANRATLLLQLGRPRAAERDCNEAIKQNPDSAKALRIRGKARKELGQWEAALKDLSASQQIDFDESTVDDLKFLTEKHLELEKQEAAERNEQEDKLRKKAAEIKKAQEEAKRTAAEESAKASAGGMPGMGGGGMPAGMEGLMASLMSDPELLAAMQNPKIQSALQEVMAGGADPAKVAGLMGDPDVGPVLQKLMSKLGGGAMPGMPGGTPGNIPTAGDDDIDLDDIPDLE